MRLSVSLPDETLRKGVFFYLRGVSSGDETLCRMLDIMFHNILLHETRLV